MTKRILFLILAVIMVFAFVSCGKNDDNDKETSSAVTSDEDVSQSNGTKDSPYSDIELQLVGTWRNEEDNVYFAFGDDMKYTAYTSEDDGIFKYTGTWSVNPIVPACFDIDYDKEEPVLQMPFNVERDGRFGLDTFGDYIVTENNNESGTVSFNFNFAGNGSCICSECIGSYNFNVVKVSDKTDHECPFYGADYISDETPEVDFSDGDFKLNDVLEMNRIGSLFKRYDYITKRNVTDTGITTETHIFKWNNHRMIAGSDNMSDPNDRYYFYDDYMLTKVGNHYKCSDYGDMEDTTDDYITDILISCGDDMLSKSEKSDVFIVKIGKPLDYLLCELNKKDLSVQKITINPGSMYEMEYILTYNEEYEDFGITDGWTSTKEITVVEHFMVDGNEADGAYSVVVPYNIEYWNNELENNNCWMNDDYTIPYKYPGNGKDYTIYCTNTEG